MMVRRCYLLKSSQIVGLFGEGKNHDTHQYQCDYKKFGYKTKGKHTVLYSYRVRLSNATITVSQIQYDHSC